MLKMIKFGKLEESFEGYFHFFYSKVAYYEAYRGGVILIKLLNYMKLKKLLGGDKVFRNKY